MNTSLQSSMVLDNEQLVDKQLAHAAMHFDALKWKQELKKLINKAATTADQKALCCFEIAMTPLFNDPEKLKTLLGKIAMVT